MTATGERIGAAEHAGVAAPARLAAPCPARGDILQAIAAHARQRMAAAKGACPPAEMRARAREMASVRAAGEAPFPFEAALRAPGMSFICEVKRASPSRGLIAPSFPYLQIARDYERGGAAAISCLTEPRWFQGEAAYLRDIATQAGVPVLRKDFVVDAYMVYEARALGASAVLLICALLTDDELAEYVGIASELGMSCLVEAHDEREIARALAAGARVVGVNNRDLRTFEVDLDVSRRLRALVPPEVLFVSESGYASAADVARSAADGVDAVLVGEALMRAPDRAAALARLRGGVS